MAAMGFRGLVYSYIVLSHWVASEQIPAWNEKKKHEIVTSRESFTRPAGQ